MEQNAGSILDDIKRVSAFFEDAPQPKFFYVDPIVHAILTKIYWQGPWYEMKRAARRKRQRRAQCK